MKKKIIAFSLIITGFSFQACDSLVEVEPQTAIASETALNSLDGYKAVLISAYDRLQNFNYYGRDFQLLGDALADNILTESTQAAGRYLGANQNARGAHYDIWGTAYDAINDVNIIIAGIDNLVVPESQENEKKRVKAEALALRGLLYFDLARVYGYEPGNVPTTGVTAGNNLAVPIRLTPTTVAAEADLKKRATIEEVYTQIEADYKAAIEVFNTLPNTSINRFFINGPATHALLGKAHLYQKEWADAEAQLKLALEKTQAVLSTNIVSAFAGGGLNPESLFELNFIQATEMGGVTGVNNSAYSYTNPTGTNDANVSTYGGQLPSADLRALFGETDIRQGFFYERGSSTSGALKYWWSNKYSGAQGAYTDNVKIIRYADVLLMLAEAHAEQGETADAIALLERLRTSRGATITAIPTAAPALINFIMEERRRELFFEGHRFFDLKRKGMAITKATGVSSGIVDPADYRILGQLPAAQIILNPELVQNPGY